MGYKLYSVSHEGNFYDGMTGKLVQDLGQCVVLEIEFTWGSDKVTFYKNQVEELE